jgi:hypothetical protein
VIDRTPAPRFEATALPPSLAVQAVRSVWQQVHAEEQRMLEEISLADLVRKTQPTSALSYQI